MTEILKGNVYEQIVKRCKKNGITITELCKRSGVKRHKFNYWVSKNPATIETLVKLNQTLNKIESDEK